MAQLTFWAESIAVNLFIVRRKISYKVYIYNNYQGCSSWSDSLVLNFFSAKNNKSLTMLILEELTSDTNGMCLNNRQENQLSLCVTFLTDVVYGQSSKHKNSHNPYHQITF